MSLIKKNSFCNETYKTKSFWWPKQIHSEPTKRKNETLINVSLKELKKFYKVSIFKTYTVSNADMKRK